MKTESTISLLHHSLWNYTIMWIEKQNWKHHNLDEEKSRKSKKIKEECKFLYLRSLLFCSNMASLSDAYFRSSSFSLNWNSRDSTRHLKTLLEVLLIAVVSFSGAKSKKRAKELFVLFLQTGQVFDPLKRKQIYNSLSKSVCHLISVCNIKWVSKDLFSKAIQRCFLCKSLVVQTLLTVKQYMRVLL